MSGENLPKQGLNEIMSDLEAGSGTEPETNQPLDPDDFKTGKEDPSIVAALDKFEKDRDAIQTAPQPAETKLAKSTVLGAEIKQLGDKYEGVRDEVARLSQEIGSGKLNPKQIEFKNNIKENLKRDYFRELIDSVVTGDSKLGTEVVRLGMDYPEIAKDHPYQDMLQELGDTLLERTQAKGQFDALIASPQKGEVAVQKLRERIAENMEGLMKSTRSKLEMKYGARGQKAKDVQAKRERIGLPKVVELKPAKRPLNPQLQEFFNEVRGMFGRKPKAENEDQKKDKAA